MRCGQIRHERRRTRRSQTGAQLLPPGWQQSTRSSCSTAIIDTGMAPICRLCVRACSLTSCKTQRASIVATCAPEHHTFPSTGQAVLCSTW
jgi:hypothetical protein